MNIHNDNTHWNGMLSGMVDDRERVYATAIALSGSLIIVRAIKPN